MNIETTPLDQGISAAAAEITSAAKDTALGFFRGSVEIDIKVDESPVTIADLQIEREARDILARHFPSHSILGEEYGAGDLTNDDVWIIDPIDGTRSFISGHPLFGFLLAYVNQGRSDLGVVSMPALNEEYVGQRGQGATLNGEPISVSKKTSLKEAILYINEGEKLFEFEPEAHARLVVSGHTRRFGYDSYPHALLAAGHIDAVVDYDLKPFDYLPLVGLIEAAGGIITDWDGNTLNYASDGRVVSAATPELHAELLALLLPKTVLFPSLITNADGPAFEILNEAGDPSLPVNLTDCLDELRRNSGETCALKKVETK